AETFGMACSASEAQRSDDNAGLLELAVAGPVGVDLRECLGLVDVSIEIGLTPNRGDCLSLVGLAREVGAIYSVPVEQVAIMPAARTCDDVLPVEVSAPTACPRYLGRVVRNVDVSRPTPLWIVERLRRSDIRSIDAVVDITN